MILLSLKQDEICAKPKDANVSPSSKNLGFHGFTRRKEITSDEIRNCCNAFKYYSSNPQLPTVEMIEQQIQQHIETDQSE